MYIVTHLVLEGLETDGDLEETLVEEFEFKNLVQAAIFTETEIASVGGLKEIDPNNNKYEIFRCFKKQTGSNECYHQFGITYKFEEA